MSAKVVIVPFQPFSSIKLGRFSPLCSLFLGLALPPSASAIAQSAHRRNRSMKKMWFLIALALLRTSQLAAQATVVNNLGDVISRPMPGSGHDYIKGLVETVNPANGQLSIKIDLPVPADRGLTIPYAITYNSGELYYVSSSFFTGCGGLGNPYGCYAGGAGTPGSTNRSSMGWSDTYPYVTLASVQVPMPPYGATCTVTGSYNFYDPTGASHMLGLAAISVMTATQFNSDTTCEGATYNNTNCFNQGENGAGAEGCQGGPVYQAYAVGGDDQVFALSDYCTGAPTTPSDCQPAQPAYTVTDSNGTTYFFPAYAGLFQNCGGNGAGYLPSQIEDRNGNILAGSVTSGSTVTMQITDTLGRFLFAPWCPDSGGSGFNVGSLHFGTTWTTTQPNFSETPNVDYSQIDPLPSSYHISCNASFAIGPTNPISVLQSLVLPNGQQYTFKYDSKYGLVDEIDYPDGGWVKYQWALNEPQYQQYLPGPNELATFAGKFTQNTLAAPEVGACNYIYKTPVIVQRTVGYSQGSAPALTQTFGPYFTHWASSSDPAPNPQCVTWANVDACWTSKQTTVTTTDNVINKTSTTTYNYTYVFQPPQPNSIGQTPAELPVEHQITYTDWGSGPVIETVNKQWFDQFELEQEQTVWNTGKISQMDYSYNPIKGWQSPNNTQAYSAYSFGFPGQIQNKQEYDYNSLNSAARITNYGYYTFNLPSGATIAKPNQVIVTDGGNNWFGGAYAFYDQGATTSVTNLPSGSHDEANYGPGSASSSGPPYGQGSPAPRGNPTTVISCASSSKMGTPCTGPTTTYTFDESGQELSRTGPCGNGTCVDMPGVTNQTTKYSYTDSFASGGPPSGNTNAYLTKITDPLGFTEQFQYNYTTGELAKATDENGQSTQYIYSDPLNRLTQTINPDNGGASISYYDPPPGSSNPATVTTTTVINSSQSETSVAVRDGLGHVIHTQLISDPSGTDYVDTTYDGEGHVFSVSNPYRSTSDPTYGLTTNAYDALGRPILTQHPDNTKLQWCYNGVASTPAVANCTALLVPQNTPPGSITGTWVDSTDENGNHWQRASDAFGRLTQVMEPNGASQSPSMQTSYNYDALNNLLSVKQCGGLCASPAPNGPIARFFAYDNLSRLLSAANPETGTVNYAYDLNGNVQTKTDARSIVTSYIYNGLNQVLSKSYSDGATPLSCYQYGTSPNSVERLINEWTQSASATALCQTSAPFLAKRGNIAYDPMGRILTEQQYTLATQASATQTPYSPAYSYDLAGNLISSTTGVGPTPTTAAITFTNTIDNAGRLQTVNSNVTSNWVTGAALPATLFSPTTGTSTSCTGLTAQYWPFGGLMNATLGNGLTLNRAFDNRLRTTCETDTGSVVANSIPGSAAVTITGAEQSH